MTDTPNIPEGFREVELDWSELPVVDWHDTESVQGIVVAGRYVMLDKGGYLGATMLLRLENALGHCVLWESARLTEFFAKLRVTDEVLIRHTGKKAIKGKRQVNTFQAFVKPGEKRHEHAPAFGARPEPKPIPQQIALPGMDSEAAGSPKAPEFDDDIPF